MPRPSTAPPIPASSSTPTGSHFPKANFLTGDCPSVQNDPPLRLIALGRVGGGWDLWVEA